MKNYKLVLLGIYLCGLTVFALAFGFQNETIYVNSKGEQIYPRGGYNGYYLSKDNKTMDDITSINKETLVFTDFFLVLACGLIILFVIVLLMYLINSYRQRKQKTT